MRTTEHFNLNLVEGTDLVNPLTQDVPNYEAIDEQMWKNQNNGTCVATELKTGSVHAINRTVPDCAMFRFTATSDFVAGDTFTVDGVQVTGKLASGEPLGTGSFVINSEVLCVLVGTLLTLYVPVGKVELALDSEKLGGESPDFYAKKSEVDQAQSLAEATAVIAQNNQNSIDGLNSKIAGIDTYTKLVWNGLGNPFTLPINAVEMMVVTLVDDTQRQIATVEKIPLFLIETNTIVQFFTPSGRTGNCTCTSATNKSFTSWNDPANNYGVEIYYR